MDVSSKGRLTTYDLGRFSSSTLFDRLGRALCEAGVLPRKELYEAWQVARRTRRLFRGGLVVDAGGGHGLLAHMMLILDDSSPSAVVVDPVTPSSASAIAEALYRHWPRLQGRVARQHTTLDHVALEPTAVVVSCHGCGALTDRVIDASVRARARLSVLPCCHDDETCEPGPLRGWMDLGLAVDTMRAVHLQQHGYRVWTQTIPRAITPKNRLLLGAPL